ncbi:PAS domain-containing protein [Legionella sp. WA2022007384]
MNGISSFSFEALNATNDGIAIVDMKQTHQPIVFINPSFEQLTGYSAEEVIGKNCRFLQGSLPSQPETLLIRQALSEQKNCRIILRNMRKNGTIFFNELSLAPIKEKNKDLSFYIGIQRDVTHELMQYQTITQALEKNKIDAMQQAISSFADQVSQPLTAISIYSKACSLIMEKEKKEWKELTKIHEGLEKIEAQALVVKEIIRTINTSFNELNFFVEKLNPNDVIIQLVNIIKYTCPYNIQLELDSQLPEININREHLVQILLNLIRNSIEVFQLHSLMGGQITISTAKRNDFIELKVSDNGPGMAEEFLYKEPGTFFTSKTYGVGTGFGICKKLIDIYGGKISFKKNDNGFKVLILLPI